MRNVTRLHRNIYQREECSKTLTNQFQSKLPKFGKKICIEDMHTKRIRYQNLAEDEIVANNNQPQESDAYAFKYHRIDILTKKTEH